jgi:glucose-6-phosphate 1-dehydrogenase
VIKTLVLLGATGDLAGRYLLPALAALRAAERLPDDFQVIAAARQDLGEEAFQQTVSESLERHSPLVSAAAREDLIRSVRYHRTEMTDPASISSLLSGIRQPVAVYLALPPGLYTAVVTTLGSTGLPAGSRIALEKPFGEDLDSAVALNRLLVQVVGTAGEQTVFRVDHVPGLPTVQDLLALRLANRVLEPVWNSRHIEQIHIRWEEDLGLEGRAGYFDRSGTLRDVMQNHMLQILSLIAMELPASIDEQAVRDRKVDALRSVRRLSREEAVSRTRRARYASGWLPDPAAGGAPFRRTGTRTASMRAAAPRPSLRSCWPSTASGGRAPVSCSGPARRCTAAVSRSRSSSGQPGITCPADEGACCGMVSVADRTDVIPLRIRAHCCFGCGGYGLIASSRNAANSTR